MSVLLSIKPKFVEQIMDGSKLYEFRKAIFKSEVDEVWVYSSSPIKRIVGKIIVENIIEDSPEDLWENFSDFAGIDETNFFKYFEGKEKGYAIKIKDFVKFKDYINPYEKNPDFTPPQSFAYLSNILPDLA